MADVTDVQNALVSLIAQALYPSGTGQPSLITAPVKTYPGWPQEAQLDADLIAGIVNISVFPSASERNTTRYPQAAQDLTITAPTLTLTIAEPQITVGGAMPGTFFAQNAMVMVGGLPYVYATQQTDTLTSIATALAALIPGASSVGAVITCPTGKPITAARIGTIGTQISELRRQERIFTITVWAPTPTLRDSASVAVDVALSKVNFLTMADTSAARLIYKNSLITDALQKAKLYRRDLNYTVEYAITETITAIQVSQQLQINMGISPVGVPISTTISSVQINI